MKKLICLLLIVFSCLFLIGCDLFSKYTSNLEYTLIEDNTAYKVSKGKMGNVNKLLIPPTYEELPVTKIDDRAFKDCSSINSVSIPDSITSIGIEAFQNCDNLKEISISQNVTFIGKSAFFGCNKLEKMTIPFVGESFGSYSFFGYIFGAITPFDNEAYVSSSLKTVIISEGPTEIPSYAFYHCTNLTTLVIPSSVGGLGENILTGCMKLESLSIPMLPAWIGYYFGGLTPETDKDVVPSTLSTIVFTKEQNYIPPFAFFNCAGLFNITLPDSVTYIGNNAFKDCIALTKIVIPKNAFAVESDVFVNCPNLNIYCEVLSQPSNWNTTWNKDNNPVTWGYTE